MLAHPLVQRSPLCTRDALYGGRTEAMRLHYKHGRIRSFNMSMSSDSIRIYASFSSFPWVFLSFKSLMRVKIKKRACAWMA